MGACCSSLDSIDIDAVPRFPGEGGARIPARIIRILDGDTVEVVFMYGREPMRSLIRLDGIDAPELHPREGDQAHRELEKQSAEAVRSYLIRHLDGAKTTMRVHRNDKFGGRLIASLYRNGEDVSKHLLDKGLVRVYNGERKSQWSTETLTWILRNV